MNRLLQISMLLLCSVLLLTCKKDESTPTQTPTTGTIQGKVTNATGDTVIANAIVTTSPGTSSVSTNTQGSYTIPNVSPGPYTVTAAKGGYNSGSVAIAVSAGQTTTADIQISPTQSVSKLLFASNRDGNSEIYSANTDGSNIVRLTNNSAEDYWARLNPTKDKIGFVSRRSGQYEVYWMNLDGSAVTRITTGGTLGGQYGNGGGTFDWTNDGKIIYTKGRYLCKVNIDGSGLDTLWTTPSNRNLARVACSRASGKVAISTMGPWAYDVEIYVMNTDGTNPTMILPNDPGYTCLGKFSPDGSRLSYYYDVSGHEESSGRNLDDHIFIINPDGTGKIDLSANKPSGTNDQEPTFLPTGAKVLFNNSSNVPGPQADIWIMNNDGTNRTIVITNGSDPECR